MDKLINYGSDDEYEESPKREKKEYQERRTQSSSSKATDVNYDDVSMDLSEDSDGSGKGDRNNKYSTSDAKHHADREHRDRRKERRESPKSSSSSRYNNRPKEDERSERHERERHDDNNRYSREKEDSGRYNRDDGNRYRRDRDEGRERNRYRDRRERRSRSRSGGRRRRSSSRERGAGVGGGGKFGGGYSRRFEKASNKMAHLEKMGIEIKAPEGPPIEIKKDDQNPAAGGNDKNFFLPGVTGRLREQMERRKLLWQKKEPEKAPVAQQQQQQPVSVQPAGPSKTGKVWEATIFAQDQDGKQASKFKRLMGIRESTGDSGKSVPDIVKKQEELFSTMEQQYEVARTATHTMRGVGLGFGSYQR